MEQLELIKGSDRPIEIQLLEEKCDVLSVFDLSNFTEVVAKFKNTDGTYLEKKQTEGGIQIVSANNGEIKVLFENSETELLKSGKCLSFEVVVTLSIDGGVTLDTYIWPFEGVLDIKERFK